MTAVQDVFVIPDGSAGALAELERRKFTAEEGVRLGFFVFMEPLCIDHPDKGPSHASQWYGYVIHHTIVQC